jgi:hypothetical protein
VALTFMYCDQPGRAEAMLAEGICELEQRGLRGSSLSFGFTLLAYIRNRRGKLVEAENLVKNGLRIADRVGSRLPAQWQAIGTLIEILLARGRLDAPAPATPRCGPRSAAGIAWSAPPSVCAPPRAVQPPDPQGLNDGLDWVLTHIAVRRGPLFLVLDDAHWADPESLRWLASFAPRADNLPMLIVLAYRPGELPAHAEFLRGLTGHAGQRPVGLEPLSADAVGRLARGVLGEQTDDPFCWAVTAGNPFEAVELIAKVRDHGQRPDGASAHLLRDLAAAVKGRGLMGLAQPVAAARGGPRTMSACPSSAAAAPQCPPGRTSMSSPWTPGTGRVISAPACCPARTAAVRASSCATTSLADAVPRC